MNQRNLIAENKTVLLTRACHPMGMQLAREFARHGYGVAVADEDSESLSLLASQIREQAGGSVVPLMRDLAKPNAARALHATTGLRGFSPTMLVNCISIQSPAALTKMTGLELEHVLRAGVISVAELCREFLKEMLERGRGTIVNVIDDADESALSRATAAYVRAFGKALALEIRDTDIQILTVEYRGETEQLVRSVFSQLKLA